MPNEQPATNWVPWLIAAFLGYLLWQDRQNPKPDPVPPPVVENVESITKSVFADMKKAYAATFEEAANKVSSKELTSDRSLLDFVRPKIEEGRKSAQQKFDAMVEKNIPEKFDSAQGVADVVTFLRRVSRSW